MSKMMKPRAFRMPHRSTCPRCGHQFDSAASWRKGNAAPKPHDLTACIGCSEVLMFDSNLIPRRLVRGHIERIKAEEPELAATLGDMQRAIRRAMLDFTKGRA